MTITTLGLVNITARLHKLTTFLDALGHSLCNVKLNRSSLSEDKDACMSWLAALHRNSITREGLASLHMDWLGYTDGYNRLQRGNIVPKKAASFRAFLSHHQDGRVHKLYRHKGKWQSLLLIEGTVGLIGEHARTRVVTARHRHGSESRRSVRCGRVATVDSPTWHCPGP